MAWYRYEVKQPVSNRQPDDDKSLLKTVQKELWPFFQQVRLVLNWAARWLGKVQVDSEQTPVALADAVVAGTGVTITQIGTTPDQQLEFKANATEITTIVTTTIIEEAATTGATLFPCDIPDPLLRESCVGLLPHGEGVGFGSVWTQIAGISTWQFVGSAGALVPQGGTLQAQDGDFIFAWSSVPYGDSEPEAYGLYEVVDCGFHWVPTPGHPETLMGVSTQPVIRRASSANTPAGLCHGMTTQVVGRDAVEFNGYYFTLDTSDPIVVDTTELSFSYSLSYTSGETTALLTSSQVASEHASTATADAVAAVGGAAPTDVSLATYTPFVTLAGTPGASEIPAGKWRISQRVYVDVVADTPPLIYWQFRVVHDGGGVESPFLVAYSPPITSTGEIVQTFEAELASPVTIVPTDMIEAIPYAYCAGPDTVQVHLVWQNLARDTRIVTTIPMGGVASGVHNDLTGRDADDCHPISAITDLKPRLDGIVYPHGWPLDDTGARLVTMSYDSSTRKVTITAISGSTFDVWHRGVLHTEASPFVSDAHDATEGEWFLDWDGSAFTWSNTYPNFFTVSPAALAYWSSVDSKGAAWYEWHGSNRDLGWHREKHATVGTLLVPGTGILYGYTLSTGTDAAIKFGIAACTIYDEDIKHSLAEFTVGSTYTVYQRSGTSGYWTWTTGKTFPWFYGTYPQRNYDAGGGTGWTLADIDGSGTGSYMTYYVLAAPAMDATNHRFVMIPGQTQYASVALAQVERFSDLSLGSVPFQEFVPIAQIVVKAYHSYASTTKSSIEAVTPLTGSRGGAVGAAISIVHNSTTNRDATGAHPPEAVGFTGTENYLPKRNATGTYEDSRVADDGTNIIVGDTGTTSVLALALGADIDSYIGASNAYLDGATWKYIDDGNANLLQHYHGDWIWYDAPPNSSGPGATITWTERMRLSGGVLTARAAILNGSTSGQVTIAVKADAGTWTFTLPDDDGDADQVLTTDGDGNTRWADVVKGITIYQAVHLSGTSWYLGPQLVIGGSTYAQSVTSTPSVIATLSTSIYSAPNLNPWPDGTYKLALWAYMSSTPADVYYTVTAGSTVIATSETVTVGTGSIQEYPILATATSQYYTATPKTDYLTITLYASSASTNNINIGYGSPGPTSVSTPWLGFSASDPQENGTASPGSTGIPAMSDHVHPLVSDGVKYPACGWLIAYAGEGGAFMSGLLSYSGPDTSTVGTSVVDTDGVVDISPDFISHEAQAYIWPAGDWLVQFEATVTSIASDTYIRATLYEVDISSTYTAISWEHDFLLTATGATVYSYELPLDEWLAGDTTKKLALRFSTYTAATSSVTVAIVLSNHNVRVKTPMRVRES